MIKLKSIDYIEHTTVVSIHCSMEITEALCAGYRGQAAAPEGIVQQVERMVRQVEHMVRHVESVVR